MMRAMVTKSILVCLCLIFVGMSVIQSYAAKIGKETVVGIWIFDEGKGNVAGDSSGNKHDGEIIGDVKWVEGKLGKALSFPGVGGNRVKIPHKDSLNLDTWSITMWVKLADRGGWQYIFTKESPGDLRNFIIVTDNVGIIYTALSGDVWKGEQITSKTKVYDEKWHHIAATYDKETLRLYVDGIEEAQRPLTTTPIANKVDVVLGERFNGSEPVKGIIDELGLFSMGLAEDEIKDIINNGLDKALGLTAVSIKGKLTVTWGKIRRMQL